MGNNSQLTETITKSAALAADIAKKTALQPIKELMDSGENLSKALSQDGCEFGIATAKAMPYYIARALVFIGAEGDTVSTVLTAAALCARKTNKNHIHSALTEAYNALYNCMSATNETIFDARCTMARFSLAGALCTLAKLNNGSENEQEAIRLAWQEAARLLCSTQSCLPE